MLERYRGTCAHVTAFGLGRHMSDATIHEQAVARLLARDVMPAPQISRPWLRKDECMVWCEG
jgi:hypothetical protein